MSLITEPNFHEPGKRYFRDFSPGDDFYQLLINTHRDLTEQQSTLLNAKLILILANQPGTLKSCRIRPRVVWLPPCYRAEKARPKLKEHPCKSSVFTM